MKSRFSEGTGRRSGDTPPNHNGLGVANPRTGRARRPHRAANVIPSQGAS